MFTEKFGTYQCTLSIREAFMQKTQREINDAIIDEVLITGTANIAPADLKIIKGIAAEYVKDIFRRLRDHGYDENQNKETRKAISKQMKPIRERLRHAEKILEKPPHLYELLKQEHELEKKARARYLDRSR